MTTLLEIMAAIEKLSPRDYAELMAMLHPPVDDDWDLQIKADATAGRLWQQDAFHPSLHFKKVGSDPLSVRVGRSHRALGRFGLFTKDGHLSKHDSP